MQVDQASAEIVREIRSMVFCSSISQQPLSNVLLGFGHNILPEPVVPLAVDQ